MSYSIIYSDRSKFNLLEIQSYISDFDIWLADKFIKLLVKKIYENLSFTPFMYREYFEWVRFIPHKWYIVLYKINENEAKVEIITIVHWSRDLNNIKI